ncbi:HTH-type transcriptional regulator YfmP [Dictyobacter arantiisoli]|uniref:HTH-type transcriptional regulator YfmP n=2 Tax=Dictyobacter arantiisoli TaxID=2014874 RepID=A0A5A5T8B1_9CHLR|nr:HTH-type transcriptional regulator YfmP [Dictyobacter arantiisoli]
MVDTSESQIEMDKHPSCFTIEQVASRTGLTRRTLRYYEEVGLLPAAERTEGNYRRYSEEDIQRLEHIKAYKNLLGFSLHDIRVLLATDQEREVIKEAYRQETDIETKIAQLAQTDVLIEQQLQLVDQKIAGLLEMKASLQERLARHAETRKRLQDS